MSQENLCFMDATDLAAALQSGSLSAREVMTAHLEQIDRLNPELNAIVSLLPGDQCLELADAADRKRASGETLGPLHGLPIAFKDLEDATGFPTVAGSPINVQAYPARDSLLVERLRGAGALGIGKTNVPEFGLGSHTFNPVFGATKNPYDQSKTAGGSSGGAAVCLATGMLPIADGSDMGGSLRNPGNFNNVVGFRVSPGLVPTWPSALPWLPLSVKGPMARTVRDVGLMLSGIAGPDPRAQSALNVDPASFAAPLDRDFRGVRVAWCPDLGGLPLDPAVRTALESQRHIFEQLGCEVDDVAPDLSGAEDVFQTLRAFSLVTMEPMLAEHRDKIKPEAIWNIEQGLALKVQDVAAKMALQSEVFDRFSAFMQRYEYVLCAVNQVPPFSIDTRYPETVDGVSMPTYISWMQSAYFITVTRHPAISVPCAFTPDGLPVGLQIVGRVRSDFATLQMAYAFEQATQTGKRRPPCV